eukprot:2107760-Prymnesium_polylepis.1
MFVARCRRFAFAACWAGMLAVNPMDRCGLSEALSVIASGRGQELRPLSDFSQKSPARSRCRGAAALEARSRCVRSRFSRRLSLGPRVRRGVFSDDMILGS